MLNNNMDDLFKSGKQEKYFDLLDMKMYADYINKMFLKTNDPFLNQKHQ